MIKVAYRIYSEQDIVYKIDGMVVGDGTITVANIDQEVSGWSMIHDEENNPALGTEIEDESPVVEVILKRFSDDEEYVPTNIGDVWLGPRPPRWPWLA